MTESPVLRQFDEQFAEMRRRLAQQMEKDRRVLVGGLLKGFRRLRGYQNEAEWISALLDACGPFCTRSILFVVNSGKLEWKSAKGFEVQPPDPIAISDAPAFASAIDAREVTVALSVPGEISSRLTHLLGVDARRKIVLVPVVAMDRVAAVLYAEDAEPDGLEMVCEMAGAALDRQQAAKAAEAKAGGLLRIAPMSAAAPAPEPARPVEEEVLHLRAQRLARKLAAEIRLHEAAAVKIGRAAGNLYDGPIRERIDQARQVYRNQFAGGASIEMPDYLHLELVRMLANGEERLLGEEYPGPAN